MKRLGALILLLPLAGCAVTAGEYAKIDTCVAAGQAWNYRVAIAAVGSFVSSVSRSAAGVLSRRCDKGMAGCPKAPIGIVAHNPSSAFHLSLRIGYPTAAQLAAAAERGVNPGGDIMIHGLPNQKGWIGAKHTSVDWTDGCIAVTSREMEWLYKAVPDGTPVEIQA